jgi:hypothetical protein
VGPGLGLGRVVFTTGQVDLTSTFHFENGRDEHNAQFNWNIHRLSGFHRQLGISLGVFQPATP